MENTNTYKDIDNLNNLFNEKIEKWEFLQAQNLLQEIDCLHNLLSIKLQKSLNKNIKGIFLQNDPELENIRIYDKIRIFLEDLKKEYWKYIIDEITILRLHWDFVLPIYFYSLDTHKLIEQLDNVEKLNELKNELTKDLKFFVENVIKKWGLEDWEGTLAGNQTWNSYDIILRIGDFLICFNNTEESIETLNHKLWIDMESLISKVSWFYKEFKK